MNLPSTQPSGIGAADVSGPRPFESRPVTVSRRYPAAPMVGAGVAIFDGLGRVLLAKSGKPGRKHPWGLPGGLLDLGEKVEDGARREVREECGIEIEIGGFNGIFDPIDWDEKGDVEYHFVVVEFWARYLSGEPTPGDDIVEVVWAPLDDLARYDLMPVSIEKIRLGHAEWGKTR